MSTTFCIFICILFVALFASMCVLCASYAILSTLISTVTSCYTQRFADPLRLGLDRWFRGEWPRIAGSEPLNLLPETKNSC